jgi:hypothetical protein
VGFSFSERNAGGNTMAIPQDNASARPHAASRLSINVDLIAVTIALALAALIRFNILPSIPF